MGILNNNTEQSKKRKSTNRLIVLISLAIVMLMMAMMAIFWHAYEETRDVADRAAISDAGKFVNAVAQYRNFYTQIVVPRAGALGANFTHDYLAVTNSLPLPATFIKDFAEFVSHDKETQVRMYSDLPFPWRVADGGVRDDFEREAMKQARENPTQPYWRIEDRDGVRVLRYAKPDVLLDSCIGCHNSYEGTPKTDWKAGEVRGVFELSRPLADTEGAIRNSFNATAMWLALLCFMVLLLLVLTLLHLIKAIRLSQQKMQQAQDAQHNLSVEMAARADLHEALLREEQKLVAIFSSVADAIVVIDSKGIIRQVNNAVLVILGYQPTDLIGQNISILTPEPHASAHDGYLHRYMESRQARIIGYTRQLQAVRKDGSLVDIDLAVNEVKVGNDVFFAGVIRDVTLRLEAERTLKVARDKAIENAKAKSQFLTNISHELRTPLNGIMGMSQLLTEDLIDTEDREQARLIQTSAQQLLTIVDDILDFSSMENARFTLNPAPFYVQSWLFDSLAVHLQAAQEKGLSLYATINDDVPARMIGDAPRLSQIINKLVSNAIKFTREGQITVELKMGIGSDSAMPLIISVKDTGIGISELAMSRLFQAFSQVDGSATRAYGGTGLGLVISRQLALLMGGDVRVTSVLGQGSLFEVTLVLPLVDDEVLSRSERLLTAPVSGAPKVESKEEKPLMGQTSIVEKLNEPANMMKILLIEDNIVNQKVATALLKRMGYCVEVANNGQEGLDRLEQESFDAILMDCQMPVMDGYEASRQIRSNEIRTGRHMPIIALTAHAMKGDAEKCYEAGMDDYLTKPINHGLLKERLEYWQNWLSEHKKI